MGFEPTNGGFADLSLGPLGYRALSSVYRNYRSGSSANRSWRVLRVREDSANPELEGHAKLDRLAHTSQPA